MIEKNKKEIKQLLLRIQKGINEKKIILIHKETIEIEFAETLTTSKVIYDLVDYEQSIIELNKILLN